MASEERRLTERVAALEAAAVVRDARIAALEAQHTFGVEQMNRIEATQSNILDEIKRILPLQETLDGMAAKLNAAADRAAAATSANKQ